MSNNMSDVRRKRRDENLPKKTRIRHGSSETLSVKETMKPEAMPELMQIRDIQSLKLNIEDLLRKNIKGLITIDRKKNDDISKLNEATKKSKCYSKDLQLQEERTKLAFLENEAAEKETERKLGHSISEDIGNSVDTLAEHVKKELDLSDQLDQQLSGTPDDEMSISLESGLNDLSNQIVERLLSKFSVDGNQEGLYNDSLRESFKVYRPILNETKNGSEKEELTKGKTHQKKESTHLEGKLRFELQQAKYQINELETAVSKERQQSLQVMEKLNEEKNLKCELQEEIFSLKEDLEGLQTQLFRHQDEIEEMTSLYEAEKFQNCILEEAIKEEKENFNKISSSLDEERQRSKEISVRDSDTIMDLRTALEVEKEHSSRLCLDSPLLGKKSNNGSKVSLYGSRHSLPGYKSPALLPGIQVDGGDKLLEELLEERDRCDRLKECLEIERDKSDSLAESSEIEVQGLLKQLKERDAELLEAGKKIEQSDTEKVKILKDLEQMKEKLHKYNFDEFKQEKKHALQKDSTFFDLESKLEAYRIREEELQQEINELKSSVASDGSIFPTMKNRSFGIDLKIIPANPQDQAVCFFKKLLRVESYRKALVWQKRYLSLLISSYQESEILSLGRLARMSGARRTIVADIPKLKRPKVQFRAVVYAVISISRMKFLVGRWKNTKRSLKKFWVQDSSDRASKAGSEGNVPTRQATEELEPKLDFLQK